MTPTEFDPDDNFGNSFASPGAGEVDDGDDATTEMLVWQLLLLVNPGDEELALQQFDAWRDAAAGLDVDEPFAGTPLRLLAEAIDWRSGFNVDWRDGAALMDSLAELVARWNLRIDWDLDDVDDDEAPALPDVPSLMAIAYDRLREHGYTLWTWNTEGESHAGWIGQSAEDEAMRVLAAALGIELRPGNEAY